MDNYIQVEKVQKFKLRSKYNTYILKLRNSIKATHSLPSSQSKIIYDFYPDEEILSYFENVRLIKIVIFSLILLLITPHTLNNFYFQYLETPIGVGH